MLRTKAALAALAPVLLAASVQAAIINVKRAPVFANEQVLAGTPQAQTTDTAFTYRDATSEARTVYEWPLPALPAGSTITAINYNGYVSNFSFNSITSTYPNVSFHGYVGNGVFDASDATVPFNNIGQSGAITAGAAITFGLTTAYAQSLALASKPYLGTMLYAEQTGFTAGLLRPGNVPATLPNIQYIANVPNIGTVHAKPLYDALASYNGTSFAITDGAASVNTQQFAAASVDRRGLLSFDLGGIPQGATITSATLTFHVDTITFSGSNFPQVGIYARFDNGRADVSDATTGSLVATTDPITATNTNITVNLSVSTLQTIFNSGGFMGFTILGSANNEQFGFDTSELSLDSAPSLDVAYSSPEPASAAFLALGTLPLLRRRKRR